MKTCSLCGWSGDDVNTYVGDREKTNLCMACQTAVSIFNESKTVGKMNPARLVILMRAVVAQSVGSIVASVFSQLADVTGKEEFAVIVDNIKKTSSTDPN